MELKTDGFPFRIRKNGKLSSLTTFIQYCTGDSIANAIRVKKESKDTEKVFRLRK